MTTNDARLAALIAVGRVVKTLSSIQPSLSRIFVHEAWVGGTRYREGGTAVAGRSNRNLEEEPSFFIPALFQVRKHGTGHNQALAPSPLSALNFYKRLNHSGQVLERLYKFDTPRLAFTSVLECMFSLCPLSLPRMPRRCAIPARMSKVPRPLSGAARAARTRRLSASASENAHTQRILPAAATLPSRI